MYNKITLHVEITRKKTLYKNYKQFNHLLKLNTCTTYFFYSSVYLPGFTITLFYNSVAFTTLATPCIFIQITLLLPPITSKAVVPNACIPAAANVTI